MENMSGSEPKGKLDVSWLLAVLLLAAFLLLFAPGFWPGQVHFANDGPLGQQVSPVYDMPAGFFGIWNDTWWLGLPSGSYPPGITSLLLWAIGPVSFNKFSVPISQLILGACAWLFFRRLGFRGWVCTLGGVAAALNSNFFSNGAWGLTSRALSLAATFLALAAIQASFSWWIPQRVAVMILAGIAIGLSINEGGDNGAIFSLFAAGYAFFQVSLLPGSMGKKMALGAGRVLVMATFAALVAIQSLNTFKVVAFKGVAGMEMDQGSKRQRWDFATQWSLPKLETLRVVIPGLFGYRMDAEPPTPAGGVYWGTVGQQPGWEIHGQGFVRYSGAGEYAGVLVVLVALWGVAESLRRKENSIFGLEERRLIWFWGVAALAALALAWGRHAPFYQLVYALPYFSTIRNPMKFMHPFHLALLVLFAYGLQGLCCRYLETDKTAAGSIRRQVKIWWYKAASFEWHWAVCTAAVMGLSVVGWLAYLVRQRSLVFYLEHRGFEEKMAAQIARFSAWEVGLFIIFLAASMGLVIVIMSGALGGRRARRAILAIGVILVVDLARANVPWVKYYDYKARYASNGVLAVLRENAHEHRLFLLPFQLGSDFKFLQQVYHQEWLQHQFPYYGIQALDIPQDPRPSIDKVSYRTALARNPVRLWELTNTRFLAGLGLGGSFVETLNQQLDQKKRRFRLHTAFSFFQDGDLIGVETNLAGPCALFEFSGALPRAKLYANWQLSINRQATLATLASPAFDPHQMVIVEGEVPPLPGATNVNHAIAEAMGASPGTVKITSYAPKQVRLRAQTTQPAILLLNDSYDPGWQATVNGNPVEIWRANFLARAIYLEAPGTYQVEFSYRPSLSGLYVSLGVLALGVSLGIFLVAGRRRAS